MKFLGVVPARLSSTRLPRKVLREIQGVPMVVHVFNRLRDCRVLTDILVATDSDEVVEVCHAHHIPAVITSPRHPTGTDRVWEVAQGRAADVYVNVQGDEPLVTCGHIEKLVRPFLTEPEVQVTTLKIRATAEEVATRTANKVVTNVHGDALYFSRLPIPYDRDAKGGIAYWKHIGLYAYRRTCLETFHRLPPSPLEQAEQLEQLRLLEAGIPIRVLETNEQTIGVDTEEDLRAVEAALHSRSR
ncbi:MAG TPA: 3-deoxy-manno-octulosonate cytidylyltransferase [Methylomirabilota bacterium]|nr:3-deoxy-manno-octulosonate cytidylyltransferase [Methylomirabilota bacterium]